MAAEARQPGPAPGRAARAALDRRARCVKPGGRLVYATCSVLPEENGDQIAWFLANHPGFATLPWREAWARGVGGDCRTRPTAAMRRLLLTPARHGTDGFFIAVLAAAGLSVATERRSTKKSLHLKHRSSTDKSLTGDNEGLIGSRFAEAQTGLVVDRPRARRHGEPWSSSDRKPPAAEEDTRPPW